MSKKIPEILWHHGTCDSCERRHIIVCHFGYNNQPNRDYRVCEDCLDKKAGLILKKCDQNIHYHFIMENFLNN